MSLTDLFIRRPVVSLVLSLLIVLFGLVSLPRLGVQEIPDIDRPVVTVSTVWRGADPASVESEVTEVLERELNGIEGVDLLSSESRDQVSQITVEFDLERDLEAAANDVRDRVARVRAQLPDDVDEAVVEKADAEASPVMYLRLVGDRSLLDLTDLADRIVRERLQTVPGVSSVQLFGEKRYAMRVELDLARMVARGLSVDDIQAGLAAGNVEAPAGRVEGLATDVGLRMDAGLSTAEQFSRLVIASRGGAPVRLGDVAYVRLGAEDERSAARSDGVPSVTVTIVPQSGANIIDISDAVQARLEGVRAALPAGVDLDINYDRSLAVRVGIQDVVFTLLLSTLAVIFIIGVFLQDVRATLIPTVAIGVSVVGTFAFLELAGFTINVFTLFGLVLAIGIVVDDAIVVLENIWRRIELGQAPLEAALEGTREIVFAVIATTVSLLAVFVPIVFAGGTTGRLFLEFGLTVAVAVALSSVVALTLSPMLCAKLLRPRGVVDPDAVETPMSRLYARLLAPTFRHPGLAAVVVALSVAAGGYALWSAPRDFFPVEDRNFFIVRATGPEGVGFPWMDARMAEVEQAILDLVPERTSLITRTSLARGTGPGASNSGMFGIPLVPAHERERSQSEIADVIRKMVNDVPGFRAIPIEMSTVSRGLGSPVQLAVQADDAEKLLADLPAIEEVARSVPSLSGVDLNVKLNRPETQVVVDREKARRMGVDLGDLARSLQVLTTGIELSTFRLRSRQYDVIVGLAPKDRVSLEAIGEVPIATADGRRVPLSTLVRFVTQGAPSSRYHVERMPSVTISGSPNGVALSEAVAELRAALAERLGDDVRTVGLGQVRELERASGALGLVFGLAIVLVFLVLAAQFDSFFDPVPILVSLPVAVAAGVGALFAVGETLTFFAQVGLVLLVGLTTKNGILVVEFARQLQVQEGLDPWEAASRAARLRLRPILMTATSTLGGAVPIALGLSGTSRVGLGVVVVAGMAAATVLSLFVTPVLWAWLASRGRRPAPAVPVAGVLAALLVLSVSLPARADMTLDEALAAARARDPEVMAAEADARAARAQVGVARGALLPTLSAGGRYQYGNSFVAGGAGVGGTPYSFLTATGNLDVPLVDPAAWGALSAWQSRAEAQVASSEAVALGALRSVAESFLTLQAATARREEALANVERAESLLALAEDRVAVGATVALDVTRARVVVLEDQLSVVEAEQAMALAQAALVARLGGIEAPGALRPLPEPSGPPAGPVPAERAATATATAAAAEVRQAQLRFAPRLAGFGQAGALTRLDDNGWVPTLAVGATLQWTLFGGADIADVSRLRATGVAASVRAVAATRAAARARDVANAALVAARARRSLAEATLALAVEELALAQDRYAVGADDQVPLVDALRRRAAAALAQVDAITAWNRAVLDLAVAQGSLDGPWAP